MTLTGKMAVVTGGRRGIGRALAIALLDAGAQVVVIAKSVDAGSLPKPICYIQADLSKREQRAGVIPPCDILVNNAGIGPLRPALDITPEEWDEVISLNLTAVFELSCQAVRQGCKRIVNIGSISSFAGARGISAYATSKHGLIGMTKCLSNEWAPSGVTVNCVAPGFIDTDMASDLTGDPKHLAEVVGRIPVGRLGAPEDVVCAVMFLVSDEVKYITGSTIVCDGGWLAR